MTPNGQSIQTGISPRLYRADLFGVLGTYGLYADWRHCCRHDTDAGLSACAVAIWFKIRPTEDSTIRVREVIPRMQRRVGGEVA
jgi:hypothetical protein